MTKTPRLTQIEAMLADSPDDVMLLYMLAMEHAGAGDDAAAVAVHERILAHEPYVPAFHMAGQALNRLGNVEAACTMLKNGIAAAKQQGDFHALGEMEGLLTTIE
jgi:predicted Zn-dependent protease